MKTAFLFAGQGSQKPGMGRDLYAEFEGFKNCFDKLPAEQRSIAFKYLFDVICIKDASCSKDRYISTDIHDI